MKIVATTSLPAVDRPTAGTPHARAKISGSRNRRNGAISGSSNRRKGGQILYAGEGLVFLWLPQVK